MKFENTDVWGFDHALRGMRNPLNSHHKSDSYRCTGECMECEVNAECQCQTVPYAIGKNDLDLAQRLILAGGEHRKFMRQIMVSVDITAPLYFYKEFDTYKVGTVANSTSTMHKLATTPITLDCFETDDFLPEYALDNDNVYCLIDSLERLRLKYLETKDKRYWKELIRWLPESWLQTRTVTMNYENLRNMYFQRKNHKLTEWSVSFCEWIELLPYAKELICYTKENKEPSLD